MIRIFAVGLALFLAGSVLSAHVAGAFDRNALDPTALDPTALDPTTLDPTTLDPTTLDSTTLDSLDRLDGKWKLDWERSESFGPAMKALEVPWLVRQMAGLVSIQVTIAVTEPDCEGCSRSLEIGSENPIKNTTRHVMLDGITRPFTDVMGNKSMDVFTWDPNRGMEMMRERILDSGKSARIYESRTVTDDLSTMVSTMTVWVEGEERASVRRILSRVDHD